MLGILTVNGGMAVSAVVLENGSAHFQHAVFNWSTRISLLSLHNTITYAAKLIIALSEVRSAHALQHYHHHHNHSALERVLVLFQALPGHQLLFPDLNERERRQRRLLLDLQHQHQDQVRTLLSPKSLRHFTSPSLATNDRAIVILAHTSTQPDELDLEIGDDITDVFQICDDLMMGTINGRTGSFSKGNVHIYHASECEQPYQTIVNLKQIISSSSNGINADSGTTLLYLGSFSDLACIRSMPIPEDVNGVFKPKFSLVEKQDTVEHGTFRVEAKYSFTAQGPNELASMKAGDIIVVCSLGEPSSRSEWWRGRNTARGGSGVGAFPRMYVRVV